MSSAGRAASLSGCVARPRGRETGLTGYAEQTNALCPLAALPWKRPNIGSRMNREVHVRIWERPEVRVLRATRHTEFYNFLIPLYGLSLGMSAGAIGMLVGARSLLAVFLSIHAGVLMDRFGTRRVTLFF